jgi:hypothetical protein
VIVNSKTREQFTLGRKCAMNVIRSLRPSARRALMVAVVGQA